MLFIIRIFLIVSIFTIQVFALSIESKTDDGFEIKPFIENYDQDQIQNENDEAHEFLLEETKEKLSASRNAEENSEYIYDPSKIPFGVAGVTIDPISLQPQYSIPLGDLVVDALHDQSLHLSLSSINKGGERNGDDPYDESLMLTIGGVKFLLNIPSITIKTGGPGVNGNPIKDRAIVNQSLSLWGNHITFTAGSTTISKFDDYGRENFYIDQTLPTNEWIDIKNSYSPYDGVKNKLQFILNYWLFFF